MSSVGSLFSYFICSFSSVDMHTHRSHELRFLAFLPLFCLGVKLGHWQWGTYAEGESYTPTNSILYNNILVLKTLQHVSIIIQIIFRELVGSLLKSPNLKFFKKYTRSAVVMRQQNVWCVCVVFCVERYVALGTIRDREYMVSLLVCRVCSTKGCSAEY